MRSFDEYHRYCNCRLDSNPGFLPDYSGFTGNRLLVLEQNLVPFLHAVIASSSLKCDIDETFGILKRTVMEESYGNLTT